jgi:RimJ/RimL family protein N-acetyltransferase
MVVRPVEGAVGVGVGHPTSLGPAVPRDHPREAATYPGEMGKVHNGMDARLRAFIEAQQVFFVGTAPVVGGHVNVSPKGLADTFVVVDEHTVAYLDLTASGAETIAHVRQNGRITLMFCSFDRTPNVVRLHGTGRVVGAYDDDFDGWVARFPAYPAARAVIVVDVHRVSDSCGYSLPTMTSVEERDLLTPNMERRGAEGILDYRRLKNRTSIDGLPAFDDDDDDRARPGQPVGEPVGGWTPRPRLEPVTLAGRFVDVVPLAVEQADPLYAATCGPGREPLWTYLGDEMPASCEAFAGYLQARLALPNQSDLAIVPRGGEPAGMASWMRQDPVNGVVEIGSILFGPTLARTAAATEAMYLIAAHSFDQGYRRYEWKCDALNAPSRAAARRLGFTYEGRFRQAVVTKGRNRDTDWFSITDREWPGLADAFERWLSPDNFDDPVTGAGQRTSLSALTR